MRRWLGEPLLHFVLGGALLFALYAALGTSNWFVPYHLDLGAGSSAFTWQAVAGIGYSFTWGDVLLAYRHVYYEQKEGKLLQDISFSGPALGAAFRF